MISKRVAITGGRGVLAGAFDNRWDLRAYPGDVVDLEGLSQWMSDHQPLDAVIHLAAIVPIPRVEADPWRAFQSNVVGTGHVLEAIRALEQRPWTFVASTSHVYRSSAQPLHEDCPLEPISLYGKTKWMAEELATILANKYDLPLCVGRIFSYSSAAQPDSYLIPSLFRRIRQAQPNVTVEVAGLAGTRDFLSAHEVARIIGELLAQGATGIFNIASGRRQSLRELAEAVCEKLARTDLTLADTGGESHLVADVSKLRALGIHPRFQLDDLLSSRQGP